MSKLIIEHQADGVFVYRETDRHYRKTEPIRKRSLVRRNFKSIDENCRILPGEYLVVALNAKNTAVLKD